MNIAANRRIQREHIVARKQALAIWLSPIIGESSNNLDVLLRKWEQGDKPLPERSVGIDPVVAHGEIMIDATAITPKISKAKLEKLDSIVQTALGLSVGNQGGE